MILFKRVGDSFRHIEGREWALLSLETIGVVLGILIAFELNEWASNRSEKARHHQLMERLFEESELDVLVLRDWRENLKSLVEPEKAFAVALANGRCPAASQWASVNTLGMMPAITPPTSVYQELMGAGGLTSVDQETVRNALAKFHSGMDWTQKQIDYFREARVEPLSPSDSRVRVVFDPRQKEPEVWTFDRQQLCSDRSFRNRTASATRAHVVYLNYIRGSTDDAIEMCAALGHSLGHSCLPMDGPLKGADLDLANKAYAKVRAMD